MITRGGGVVLAEFDGAFVEEAGEETQHACDICGFVVFVELRFSVRDDKLGLCMEEEHAVGIQLRGLLAAHKT